MKNLILLILCFAGFAAMSNPRFPAPGDVKDAYVKGNLSGKITDAKTGLPLSDVTVYIADARTGTVSDANGMYSIRNIPEGKHLVEISHVGFTTIAAEIIISGETTKDFVLTESVVENNGVVVTGVSRSTQLKTIPVSISVIRRQDLLQQASANLVEALTSKAGVSSIGTGPAISKPVIRGLGYNRVLTINDGVRQEGNQWGDEHGLEIDELSVSKVEILRGPGSIIYGSDALAGVINILSNVPVQQGTMKLNVLGNYQSNNNLNAWNINWAGNVKGVNWNMYGTTKSAADYSNKYDGRVFNSKFNERNFGGYIGYNGGWGFSHLLFSKFNQQVGIVEGERDSDGDFIKLLPGGGEEKATKEDFRGTTPVVPYQRIIHTKVSSDNSINLGKNRLAFNVGLQRNQRQEFGNPDDPKEIGNYFDTRTLTYTAQFHLAEVKGWKMSLGGNGMAQNHKNPGLESLIPEYTIFDIGGFFYTQKNFKKINFSAGIRYDNRNLDSKQLLDGTNELVPAFKKTFSNFSGAAGITAELTKNLNLKLNVARGFRAPSIPELASNGTHEGTNRYEYGSRDLKSETSLQFDGGFEFNTEHFSLITAAYLNSYDNFIFYRKLEAAGGGDSVINVGGDNITAFKFDQRRATVSGAEVTLDFHPHPLDWLHIENTFSFVSGRFKDRIEFTNNIPFMPAPRLLTEIRAGFDKVENNIRNFYFKLQFDNNFSQERVFQVYNTETPTRGFTLMNLGIGADFVTAKNKPLFSLYITGNNITDVAYQNHLSRLKYAAENEATGRRGVFGMGRNFSVKLNIPLSYTVK
jgi:iron complex outermembrane recepter protein